MVDKKLIQYSKALFHAGIISLENHVENLTEACYTGDTSCEHSRANKKAADVLAGIPASIGKPRQLELRLTEEKVLVCRRGQGDSE